MIEIYIQRKEGVFDTERPPTLKTAKHRAKKLMKSADVISVEIYNNHKLLHRYER